MEVLPAPWGITDLGVAERWQLDLAIAKLSTHLDFESDPANGRLENAQLHARHRVVTVSSLFTIADYLDACEFAVALARV